MSGNCVLLVLVPAPAPVRLVPRFLPRPREELLLEVVAVAVAVAVDLAEGCRLFPGSLLLVVVVAKSRPLVVDCLLLLAAPPLFGIPRLLLLLFVSLADEFSTVFLAGVFAVLWGLPRLPVTPPPLVTKFARILDSEAAAALSLQSTALLRFPLNFEEELKRQRALLLLATSLVVFALVEGQLSSSLSCSFSSR